MAFSDLTLLHLIVLFVHHVHAQDWRIGRATFYGDKPWLWSIHKGSCGYGYLDVDRGTGWDVAALADVHVDYNGGAICGSCYEVRCTPRVFQDSFGTSIDRRDACVDPSKTVIVTITDTCPCHYQDNFVSNQRWCCGDIDHFDLSMVTFDKLASRRWGVISIDYRPIRCPDRPPFIKRGNDGYLPWQFNQQQQQVVAFSSDMGK